MASSAAYLARRAGELCGAARGYARALFADLADWAEHAVVDDAVAVVIDAVAFLRTWLRSRNACERAVLALHRPGAANTGLAGHACGARARAGDAIDARDEVGEFVVTATI